MRRQELWEHNYRGRRYLEGATLDTLIDRLRITMENHTTLTPSGQIGLVAPESGGIMWMELAAHVHVEMALRGMKGPPLNYLADATIPRPSFPHRPRAVEALSKLKIDPNNIIVKLGKRVHMEALFTRGQLRISSAGSYADPSLNKAIRDDEMSISVAAPMREGQIYTVDKKTGDKIFLEARADGEIRWSASTNYYVYCTSRALDLRLFGDFGYDACVVITDPHRFFQRLYAATREHILGWEMNYDNVRYIDPNNPLKEGPIVFFDKHFRYWYQREHRAVWIPPKDTRGVLSPLNVTIGSLADIAQFAALDPGGDDIEKAPS